MKNKSRIAYLLSTENTRDDHGQYHPSDVKRKIFVEPFSIQRNEFMRGGEMGLKPEIGFKTASINYRGEKTIQYEDKTYAIYRTYSYSGDYGDPDAIELYCEPKTGEFNERYEGGAFR